MCYGRERERNRGEALSTAFFCMSVVDIFIRKARRDDPFPHDAARNVEAREKLTADKCDSYCEAVIYGEAKQRNNPNRVLELMPRIRLSKKECDEVIEFWHVAAKIGLYYCNRDLPRPDLRKLFGMPNQVKS